MGQEKVRAIETPIIVAPDTNDLLVENDITENITTQKWSGI